MAIKIKKRAIAFIALSAINIALFAVGCLKHWETMIYITGSLLFVSSSIGCYILALYEKYENEGEKRNELTKKKSGAKSSNASRKNKTKKD